MHHRSRILLYSILVFISIKLSANAQEIPEWKTYLRSTGMDTTLVAHDSVTISRLAYHIAYGAREPKVPWLASETIDSVRINQAVQNILATPQNSIAELRAIEPVMEPYRLLRQTVDSLLSAGADSLLEWKQIGYTLNQYRLANRLAADMLVLVNVPSATLRVVDRAGNVLLKCPVIVGSTGTPTPLFAAQLTRIITYPYWNVPRSIAVKEFLPKIKKNPAGFLDAMKMQVISADGKLVSPESVDWKSLSATHFPYRLRQSTGCDNALGVMKFDLNSPYDVYLHDTNHRELFGKKYRYLSHGCIRVSEPVRLANLLMRKEVFAETLTADRYHNIPSQVYTLPVKIPVMILYAVAEADSTLTYFPDIYKKIR